MSLEKFEAALRKAGFKILWSDDTDDYMVYEVGYEDTKYIILVEQINGVPYAYYWP